MIGPRRKVNDEDLLKVHRPIGRQRSKRRREPANSGSIGRTDPKGLIEYMLKRISTR